MQKIIAQESRQIILGHWAENEAVCVEFDITGWEERYGAGGHFDVLAKRQGDADYYPCHTQREDNKVLWFISSADTAVVGQGSCGLVYRVGNVVAKSAIFTTVVTEGVTNGGEVPEPWEDWTDSVLQAGAGIQQTASDASQSAADAAQSAQTALQSKVDAATIKGEVESLKAQAVQAKDDAVAAKTTILQAGNEAQAAKAEWENMTATASTLTAGAQATAHYADGNLSIGVPVGADGVSPTVEITPTTGGHRITISDATGSHTADVLDGEVTEAPADGKQYARKNGAWVENDYTDAEKSLLHRTDRSLAYLWKKSKGIIYDTETVHSNANTVTVPSGAMEYAGLDMVGGMSIRVAGVDHLIDAKMDKVVSKKTDDTLIIEKSIPQAVISLCPDYGIGVNADCYNYIDWAEKKYHHKVSCVDMGTLRWSTFTSGNFAFSAAVGNIVTGKTVNALLCGKYATSPYIGRTRLQEKEICQNIVGSVTNNLICVLDGTYSDITAFKSALSGVMLHYELAEEEVIDLSAVIPEDFEILPVEAGGTIQFHYPELDNGYSIDVPNDVTYMMNVAEVTV